MTYPAPLPRGTEDREGVPPPLPPNGPFRGLVWAIGVELMAVIVVGLLLWAVFAS